MSHPCTATYAHIHAKHPQQVTLLTERINSLLQYLFFLDFVWFSSSTMFCEINVKHRRSMRSMRYEPTSPPSASQPGHHATRPFTWDGTDHGGLRDTKIPLLLSKPRVDLLLASSLAWSGPQPCWLHRNPLRKHIMCHAVRWSASRSCLS